METSLNGTWELRDESLACGPEQADCLTGEAAGWVSTPVPGDIHQGLMAAGRIRDPLVGLNSFSCQWTEHRSWWFRRRFDWLPEWEEADVVELELGGLDSNAEVFLNAVHLGSHRNTFRPFVTDVRPHLRQEDANILLVRLTAGVDTVTEADLAAAGSVRTSTEAVNGRPERGDPRRPFVRKPQYSFGYDWNPRLATTAIAGDVTLRPRRGACIRHVQLLPTRHGDDVIVRATVVIDRLHYYRTAGASLAVSLTDEAGRQVCGRTPALLLRSGLNHVDLDLPVDEPRLWWPNGTGEQHLYRFEAELRLDGDEGSSSYGCDYGLRFVELDTGDGFALVINGEKVFCRGANWIPADALYARTDSARYETLIHAARDANLNMLRVWGGGWFERDGFYRLCDRCGIMLLHDFMFDGAPYPDHLEWFRREVEEEAEYQTRRLQHHPCIVLWSGGNENHWGFRDWWQEQTRGGAWTYNYLLPEVVRRNCPGIPYWNSSPYGGDEPNCEEVGDRHQWNPGMMSPEMERRITPEVYDEWRSPFITEYGFPGAGDRETVQTYLGGNLARVGPVWAHHTNTFEKGTVEACIRKHYGESATRDIDSFLHYSGLCQGMMYAYAIESARFRRDCHGSLLWMYADCWGELGWTLIDYYLRRKPSWYFVRRACAPARLILRAAGEDLPAAGEDLPAAGEDLPAAGEDLPAAGEDIRILLANDTMDHLVFELEYGYVSLDGRDTDLEKRRVEAPALERTVLASMARGDRDPRRGSWIARTVGLPAIVPALFRAVDYCELETVDPELSLGVTDGDEGQINAVVSASAFAHAVHFVVPPGVLPADDYFDLLPGESREVPILADSPLDPAGLSVTCAHAPDRPVAPSKA